jgi:hypothetical protein
MLPGCRSRLLPHQVTSFLELPIRSGRRASAVVRRRREPWFYLRLGFLRAGLTLTRVLRGGLELGECLGMTVAGQTTKRRLPPAPVGPGSLEALERDNLTRTAASLRIRRYCACNIKCSGS